MSLDLYLEFAAQEAQEMDELNSLSESEYWSLMLGYNPGFEV